LKEEYGVWRERFYHENFQIYNEREIIMMVKVERLRLLGQQEKDPSRNLTFKKPEGTR
jgi:hypothetical protein